MILRLLLLLFFLFQIDAFAQSDRLWNILYLSVLQNVDPSIPPLVIATLKNICR